jgi:hypothetical protein
LSHRRSDGRYKAAGGQDLLGDPIPRDPSLIDQFIFEDAEGRKPVVGRPGADPAGILRINVPGLHVIGYSSNPSPVELPAEKFNQYLKEEGLESVLGRARRPQPNRARAREIFSRCAKSLVYSRSPDRRASRSSSGIHPRVGGRKESVHDPRRRGPSGATHL